MKRLLGFAAVAALLAGGYMFFTRPQEVDLGNRGKIAAPVPQGQPMNERPPFPMPTPGNGTMPPGFRVVEQKVVELNSATLAEIETIPGITPEYARKIIAGRPYQSIGDLARTGIPKVILDDISPPAVIRVTERGPQIPPATTASPK